MEKKEYAPILSVGVAIMAFLGVIACGIVCFTLNQALKIQRRDASEARSQISALDRALKTQQHDLDEAREQLAAASHEISDAQKQNQALSQQMTEMQSKMHERRAVVETRLPVFQFPAAQADVAAADSVEGKLQSEGKNWERTEGQLVIGGYVQDTLIGRAGQPKGRGNVGKVVSLGVSDSGRPGATVDFGRGCVVGIMLTELSPVRIIEPEMR
jgi:hypothetical protein